MVYLFIGQDNLSKDSQINKIKQEFLVKKLQDFNYDVLHARELSLKGLQEKLLFLPVKSPRRLLLIRESEGLKEELKEFILGYAKKPSKQTLLVLDFCEPQRKSDYFLKQLSRYAKTYQFRQDFKVDTFSLSRQISLRKPDSALRILGQLIKDGERPERILGGLRYAWEKDYASPMEAKRKLKLLLACDIKIKTGRIKPEFALEKLILELCGPSKAFG